ncbi:MAG: hypothetical protein JXA18_07385 [Chitinispirillaceae bacterium]|nr:hypothetical protein [Chitinispirillaceae bacterium]
MDLFDSLDTLIPLLFFFIWIIVGIAARGKKRTKPGSPPVQPAAPRPRPTGGGMGELRKALQKVFEEMQVLPDQHEMEEMTTKRQVAETAMKETSATGVPEHARVTGETKTNLETTGRKIPAAAGSVPTVVRQATRKIPLSEVRRGIVWSEILQAPLALREGGGGKSNV